jgi:hypothetical protein
MGSARAAAPRAGNRGSARPAGGMLALVVRGVRGSLLLALAGAMLLLALAPGLAQPALAAGVSGGNSFNELTSSPSEGQTPTTATTATTSTTARGSSETNNNSNSQTTVLVALGAAVLLLIGIALAIMRDARRMAPAGEADLAEARSGHDPASQLRRRRAKAKAARQQRKRNR